MSVKHIPTCEINKLTNLEMFCWETSFIANALTLLIISTCRNASNGQAYIILGIEREFFASDNDDRLMNILCAILLIMKLYIYVLITAFNLFDQKWYLIYCILIITLMTSFCCTTLH